MHSKDSAPDLYLSKLVEGINSSASTNDPNRISITLHTSGATICGTMVHESVWFNQLATELNTDSSGRVIVAGLEQVRSIIEKEIYANPEDTRAEAFIHLIDPTIFANGSTQKCYSTRVRLTDVNAWSLGELR